MSWWKFIAVFLLSLMPSIVVATDESTGSSGDQSHLMWIAMCIILVMLMQCGFLLLEAGMVRSKNAINVILKNFTDIGLGSIGFWLVGFGFMFGVNSSGMIGLSDFLPSFESSADGLNFLYQLMFAATAATIVSGAVAERFSFVPYLFAALLITMVIYPIFGSWVWGEYGDTKGWLNSLGFFDMAGATVVHSIGGWCALGALLVVGPRSGRYSRKGVLHDIPGHNLPFVAIGGFILWFGWFGFNGGAAQSDFSDLGIILINTHLGAVGGIFGSIMWLAITRKGFYMTHIVNAALGGLVSVTAAASVIAIEFALLSGIIGGVIVVTTTNLLDRIRIDDVVGAVPVHGFCGAWGTLAVGLFYQGDMFNVERILVQLIGVVAALVWGLLTSYGLFWCLNKAVKLRVSTKYEQRGLDISEHHEIGYGDFMTTHVKADS